MRMKKNILIGIAILFGTIGLCLAIVVSFKFLNKDVKLPYKISLRDDFGNSLGQFGIAWVSNNSASQGVIDDSNKNIINLHPQRNIAYDVYNNTNGGARVTYQLIFNMGGSEDAPIGAINIRIPRYVFYGRDGNPLTDQVIDIPLVEYPEAAGTGFNYRFEVGTDGVDYIILENYRVIPASYAFECSMTWILKTPSTVADGYQKKITGVATVDMDLDGEIDLQTTSNELIMNYGSHATISSFTESKNNHKDSNGVQSTNVYTTWNSSWDSRMKPTNADDYVYVIWYTNGRVNYATQPYTVKLTSVPTDDLGGEVIGYCYSYSSTTGSSTESSCFSTSSKVQIDKYEFDQKTTPSSSYDDYVYNYVMVKYPKSALYDGEVHTLQNESTLTLTGVDGAYDSKVATSSSTFQYYVKPEATTVYKTVDFGPSFSISAEKYGGNNIVGGINALENKSIYTGFSKNKQSYYNYYLSNQLIDYRLTLKDGGDLDNPEDYGEKQWTANFKDDSILLGNDTKGYQILEDGDYQIKSVGIYGYSAYRYVYKTWSSTNSSTNVTTVSTGWTSEAVARDELPILKVYYKKNGNWYYYGDIITSSSSGTYNFTRADGTSIGNVYYSKSIDGLYGLPLPEGATGVKLTSTSNLYSINLNYTLNVDLLSSDHVKSIIAGESTIRSYNFSSLYSEDEDGNIYSTEHSSKGTYTRLPNNESIKQVMLEKDNAEYGKEILHGSYSTSSSPTGDYPTYTVYTRIDSGSTQKNKWVAYSADNANRRVVADYTAVAYERINYDKNVLSSEEMLEFGILREQRIGTFYDLLPIGMTANTDSVSIETFKTTSSSNYSPSSPSSLSTGIILPVSVSQIENWQGSGRTMLVVKAVMSDDMEDNYIVRTSGNVSYILSGMVLKFRGYYSWDCIPDYGSTLVNSVAYKSGSGSLSNGFPDDPTNAGALTDKRWLADLDQDGNELAINDTVYSQVSAQFNFNTASDSSFKKLVKTPNLDEYTDGQDGSAIATSGGYYTYRLRYASQRNMTTTNLIIYDILEDYKKENAWKGTLIDIDISQPIMKGVNPVIYYSTAAPDDINIGKNGKASIDQELPEDIQDLANNPLWTTTRPEDLSTITAIAIDLTKDTNGNDYPLRSEESLVVTLTMQAPVENIDELFESRAKAYNSAWWSGTTQQLDEPQHDNLSVYEWTEVLISKPTIAIDKASYVESGTNENPTKVQNGDIITYDLIINNKSLIESLSQVKFVDNLPANVIPDLESISYYYEGEGNIENSIPINSTSLIKMVASSNQLNFEISQLLSNQKIHVLIPTKVSAYRDEKITNTFQLIGMNGKEYLLHSKTTYHQAKFGNLVITKKVKNHFLDSNKFNFTITLLPPIGEEGLLVDDTHQPDSSNDQTIGNNDDQNSGNNTGNEQDPPDGNGNGQDSGDDTEPDNNQEPSDNNSDSTDESTVEHDRLLDGIYGGIQFVNGVAHVTIKAGTSLKITGLPVGYRYKVEEDDYKKDGYDTTYQNEEGIIKENEDVEAIVTNIYTISNPSTKNNIIYMILVLSFGFIVIKSLMKSIKHID